MKYSYFVMMAITSIMFIVDIIVADWRGAVLMGTSVAWLFITYRLFSINYACSAELELLAKEFNKMRERAQNAEKQLQQMIDDTPARGEDGRFVKRDN